MSVRVDATRIPNGSSQERGITATPYFAACEKTAKKEMQCLWELETLFRFLLFFR
jgi:hypothetical protein